MRGPERSVRQQRQAETARTIERNAVSLVLENGIDAVTVDMICGASSVSQRTFFNYFGTKDAAILGAGPRKLDEGRVRVFLTSNSGDLLRELLDLLLTLAPVDTTDPELARDRMSIIGSSPALLQKETERLVAVHDEVAEVVFLRLRRSAPKDETEPDTRERAALTAHVAAGMLRFSLQLAAPDATGSGPPGAATVELLARLLPRLIS